MLDRLKVRLPKLDAPVALMSGGQRQAIAVARATVFARKLVILDEPTAALGLRESRKVLDLIRQLRAEFASSPASCALSSGPHRLAAPTRSWSVRSGWGFAAPTTTSSRARIPSCSIRG